MLHDAGYAHNDIQKPNIMIGSDELPRLIDFGETTLAEPARIQNDKDRLEALFRGSVLDINELRRSRIAEQRRQRDEELEDALGLTSRGSLDFGEDTPVPKRVRMSLFD
jgi:serine/threonine protein kinase